MVRDGIDNGELRDDLDVDAAAEMLVAALWGPGFYAGFVGGQDRWAPSPTNSSGCSTVTLEAHRIACLTFVTMGAPRAEEQPVSSLRSHDDTWDIASSVGRRP